MWENLGKIKNNQALDKCVAGSQSGVAVGGIKFIQEEGLKVCLDTAYLLKTENLLLKTL